MSELVVEALFAARAESFVSAPVPALDLTFDGIAGDLHSGPLRRTGAREPWHARGTLIRNDRQISMLSLEELAEIATALGIDRLPGEWIGANVVTRGNPALSTLSPMSRLMAPSGATIVVTAYNSPCRQSGRAVAARSGDPAHELGFVRAARGRRGLVGYVEREGRIAPGDTLKVVAPLTPR